MKAIFAFPIAINCKENHKRLNKALSDIDTSVYINKKYMK